MEPFLGQIGIFGFGIVPHGWARCDGQTLSIAQNQALYALLGTTFGGDGRTTFGLPNLGGCVTVHPNPAMPQGTKVGKEQVVLTPEQVPGHTHALQGVTEAGDAPGPAGNFFAGTPFTLYAPAPGDTTLAGTAVSTAGESQGHENRQPYQAVNFCIALSGLWPPRD